MCIYSMCAIEPHVVNVVVCICMGLENNLQRLVDVIHVFGLAKLRERLQTPKKMELEKLRCTVLVHE